MYNTNGLTLHLSHFFLVPPLLRIFHHFCGRYNVIMDTGPRAAAAWGQVRPTRQKSQRDPAWSARPHKRSTRRLGGRFCLNELQCDKWISKDLTAVYHGQAWADLVSENPWIWKGNKKQHSSPVNYDRTSMERSWSLEIGEIGCPSPGVRKVDVGHASTLNKEMLWESNSLESWDRNLRNNGILTSDDGAPWH